ncbi:MULTISPECIES: GbsR/MarR family transcriptional regulator [unclassified Kribbella]|uniref:GbsR/MarR family transcriptional regulator n=1 Tax=unclassified Kribbella TaxID=2644121 RepID=UPI0030781C37
MPTDEQMTFADHVGRFYVRETNAPPVAGRLLGYLGVCQPAAQSVNELADALLASRSAITQAVVLLEGRGLVERSRARGDRVDRVSARLDRLIAGQDYDPASYLETAALLRRGVALLPDDDGSGRREALEEFASLYDFLAERMPRLKEEWLAYRAGLHASSSEEVPGT